MRKPAFLVPVLAGGALLLRGCGCGSDDGGGATGAASSPAVPGY